MLIPFLTCLLTNMSLSNLEISPYLKAVNLSYLEISLYLKVISRADVHTSSYYEVIYEVICKAGLSGLINQNLSSTISILKLLHCRVVSPFEDKSEDWTFCTAVVKYDWPFYFFPLLSHTNTQLNKT